MFVAKKVKPQYQILKFMAVQKVIQYNMDNPIRRLKNKCVLCHQTNCLHYRVYMIVTSKLVSPTCLVYIFFCHGHLDQQGNYWHMFLSVLKIL